MSIQHYTTLHNTTQHHTTLHYTTLHYTTLHYTTLLYAYYTTLHNTTLHYTDYIALHYKYCGKGHDGKTLIFVDHMRGVFGSGFGCCPCSLSQTELELRQQSLNFIQCAYMVFDESTLEHRIADDQIRWSTLPAAETKYGQRLCTGSVWNMNVGDTQHVPTARTGAPTCEDVFTNSASEPQGVFQADPSAKAFMGSWEAVWCFYNDFLFPHIKAHGFGKCSDNLECTAPNSVTARDTELLPGRMARSCQRLRPCEVQSIKFEVQSSKCRV